MSISIVGALCVLTCVFVFGVFVGIFIGLEYSSHVVKGNITTQGNGMELFIGLFLGLVLGFVAGGYVGVRAVLHYAIKKVGVTT